MMKSTRFFVILLAAMSLRADTRAAQISGPVLGYAKKGTLIRPIIGLPGAAYFGAGIDTGDLDIAAVSSTAGYALAFTLDGTGARVVPLRGDVSSQPVILMDATSGIASASVSSNGGSVALIRGRDRVVDIFTGLPAHPVRRRTIPLSSDKAVVAVSDDGESVAISEQGTILSVFEGEGYREIAAIDLRYVFFHPASHDFFYIDGDQIIEISGTNRKVLAGTPDGISDARIIISSLDHRLVFIANAGARQLMIVARSGGLLHTLNLPCEASGLERLSDSVLRFSCGTNGPVHLIDVSERGPRVLFVPEPVE
jgi:hypothetical protein